jgi:Raf kinase inhibitor-like YbhB/YbcL family protein
MSFSLTSSAFSEGQPIPRQYTGEGEDRSPSLTWSDAPEGTQSFALIVDDPDAPRGTFTHWVAFNIPAAARELGEGTARDRTLPNGTVQGSNGFGRVGYNGPKPPAGGPHRYFFKLYALDTVLNLRPGASRDDVLKALASHILAEAQFMGTYTHGQGKAR